MDGLGLLEAHLNVWWLRPESVVWDTVASNLIRRSPFANPALDLGTGNGIFSFITAGGRFGLNFDWFAHCTAETIGKAGDIYNVAPSVLPSITRTPDYSFDLGSDLNSNLLRQASMLGLHRNLAQHDANQGLPFKSGQFASIFSNILYWLNDLDNSLLECSRVLRRDGLAAFCIPDPSFLVFCESYRWKTLSSEYLRLLNSGRDASIRWTATPKEFARCCKAAGLEIVSSKSYLRRRTLALWDIGLRPVSRPLIGMVSRLNSADRATFKQEWMETVRPLLSALVNEELESNEEGGFNFIVVRKVKTQ
jgi:SAM-dependent methyltransferase